MFQTCVSLSRLWHPGSEKPKRPVFQPRDRGEVFWNTTLLSIEQTSSLLQHEYEYKVSDITMNNIGTTTLRHPQLLYASSRTTRSSGITLAAEKLLAAEQRRRWRTPIRRYSSWNVYPSSRTQEQHRELWGGQ